MYKELLLNYLWCKKDVKVILHLKKCEYIIYAKFFNCA